MPASSQSSLAFPGRFLTFAVVLAMAAAAAPALAVTTLGSNFDGIMSVIYDSSSGNVFLENAPLPNPAAQQLSIASSGGLLLPGNLNLPSLSPSVTINSATANLIDISWSSGNFLGTGSFMGSIVAPSLTQPALLSDLTINWSPWGSPQTGGDLIYGTYGTTQGNPVMPGAGSNGFFRFFSVTSGQFFDPPWAVGFHYQIMGEGSLFTKLGLPTGYGNSFDVLVNNTTVASGLLDGSDYTFAGPGVSEFTVLGIAPAVDASYGDAFPLYLEFSTPTASFVMQPIDEVLEPATLALLGVGVVGLLGYAWQRRRSCSLCAIHHRSPCAQCVGGSTL